jgi:hypothetical protein
MRIAILSMMTILVAGCGVELLATTAIRGELEAEQMKAMRGQIQHAADRTGKIRLQRAIDLYYGQNGYYPESLDVLSPGYLISIPNRPDGLPYAYDRGAGRILEEPANGYGAAPRNGQRTGGGMPVGGGPMGEAMTGIAIQNQMNSQSNAGSSAAGSYGRQKVRNQGNAHSQRQLQVMDDLGL